MNKKELRLELQALQKELEQESEADLRAFPYSVAIPESRRLYQEKGSAAMLMFETKILQYLATHFKDYSYLAFPAMFGKYSDRLPEILFANETDAMLFKLCWSN